MRYPLCDISGGMRCIAMGLEAIRWNEIHSGGMRSLVVGRAVLQWEQMHTAG